MDETTASEKGLTVLFGQLFINRFNNFPVKDQKKIFEFVEHLKTKGFTGLAGRNKSSIDVDKNDPQFLKKSFMPEIIAYTIITLAFRITTSQMLLAIGLLNIFCITNTEMAKSPF